MKNIYLEIVGKIPPKKNLWKPSRWGGIYADKSVAAFTMDAKAQIRKQLANFSPIEKPVTLDIVFFTDDRPDMDNLLGGLCDILQNCGVIANDRQVRKVIMCREKCKPKESKTIVNISESPVKSA